MKLKNYEYTVTSFHPEKRGNVKNNNSPVNIRLVTKISMSEIYCGPACV